jgi:hypothetical protein
LKYFFLAIIVSTVCLKACFGYEAVLATSQATLTVEVTSGTADGTAVTDDVVIVQIYEHEKLLQTLDSKTGVNGTAIFENVPTGEHIVAVARAKHQDMMFNSRPVVLSPKEDKLFTQVQVFDVSDDKSKLSVENHHFIVRARPEFIKITEYMQLKNSSDMAISSKERDSQNRTIVLEIMLPKGFKNFKASSYFEDEALVVTEEGFYDIMAVPPGDYDVTFSYTLDITSDSMDIVKKISLPTSNFVVFAELGRAKLEGLGEAENQLTRTDGASIKYYKCDQFAPAEEIVLQITELDVGISKLATWIISSIVLSVLVVLVILWLYPKKG